MKLKLLSLLVTMSLASLSATAAAPVTDQMIENDAKSTGDVLSWGIGQEGQRYSPLKTINTGNVAKLLPVWSFSFGGEKQRGQESQPVIHNGKMFVTASYSRIFALDAKTGAKLWKYEHRLPDGIMPCCDVINRGAALYGNLVIFATLDAQLVALNQDTGEVEWKEKIDNYADGYSASAAPLIAGGLLLTGVSGGEFGVIGRVEARDPKTGKMVWVRPVVEGHMGKKFDKDGNASDNGISGTAGKSWPGDLWKTGGAATWLGGTYNKQTGLAYFGTGNPAPWNSHLRKGDNLFSTSTVAIDIKTGQIVWHYQNTAERRLGLRRRQRVHHLRRRRRQHPGWQGRPQRLLLRQRRQDRQAGQRLPVRQEDHLGLGHRPEDRPAELHPRRPPRRPDRGCRWQEGQRGVRRPVVPGWQEPDADGLLAGDQAVLRARQ